ncbi:hypothetical protein [Bacillus sp. 165]|uniref:hypothetical protein n=1 Tax=Bacillus sp. 165 TaxID=1529117 RepID=UPI001ADD0FDD|nr:hypothetical protein [Bacillus sp. 165]MBO9129879.1 hypothetical protein [Bacillus sp. 165]
MGFSLELIRIVLILIILGRLLSNCITFFYEAIGLHVDSSAYNLIVGAAALLLLFVLYRNKLQFSGWYSGKKKKKLQKPLSLILICCSILLLIAAPFLG